MREQKGKGTKRTHESEPNSPGDKLKIMDYDPVHFLRCHSKKNDIADVQTQVWQCAFEPDVNDPKKTTSLAATCGGNSICFIDVNSGTVPLKYYAKDSREMLYALAWTVNNQHTFLVSGGIRYTVHFIHPKSGVAFFNRAVKLTKYNKNHINSLLFHPSHWNMLLCGGNHGEIHICNIGQPSPPELEVNFSVIQSFSAKSEIFSLTFSSSNNMLLAGCDDGLHGWLFPALDEAPTDEISDLKPYKFTLPVRGGGATQDLVDSVEAIADGIIATKCALHGAIYLWNLTDTLASGTCAVKPTHILRWSETDNYFMFIGVEAEAGLLCCGDDKGSLWLYDLQALNPPDPTRPQTVLPSCVLPWPHLTDPYTEKKRKLSVDTYDIVVDKVALSKDRNHILAVTNNNMVCIWKRVEPLSQLR